MNLCFEWDPKKADANLRKHGVSFEEAMTVFDDQLAEIYYDKDHSLIEHREIAFGHSIAQRLLVVCFVERTENLIRIISARLATKQERKDYEESTVS